MESFELEGKWWLPEDRDNTVAGILHCNPAEAIRLDLIGSFYEEDDPKINGAPLLINGVSKSDNKLISLLRCQYGGMQITFPGFPSSSYNAGIVLVGHLFEKPEDVVFFEFSLSYSFLEKWINQWVFEIERQENAEKEFEGLIINYRKPKTRTWHIGDYKVILEARPKLKSDRITELKVSNALALTVTPPGPINLDKFFEEVNYLFGNFLAFALGSPIHPLKILAKSPAAVEDDPIQGSIPAEIQIIYLNEAVDLSGLRVDRDNMLFAFEDIENEFSHVLSQWIEKSELLRPVYDLYFNVLNSPRVFRTHHFLNIIQALESYHRRIVGGTYVSEWGETDLYADIKELIGTVSDDDFKESLVQKIQYLNEYSLRKRLADILTRFDSIIAIFVSDKAALINDAVATRNYLTHFSERLKERAKFGGSLYTLCTRLQHILEICLMAEIGIPEAKITELIRRNRRIGLVAQRSNTTAV